MDKEFINNEIGLVIWSGILFIVYGLILMTFYLFVYHLGNGQHKLHIETMQKSGLKKLAGHWRLAILVFLLYLLLLFAPIFIFTYLNELFYFSFPFILICSVIYIFLSPLIIGLYSFYFELNKGQAQLTQLFGQFSSYMRNIGLVLLAILFQFLWSLLLIVPAVIKAFSYSQIYFIRSENPELSALEVITLSRKIMDGNKLKLFRLYLSFVPWFLLLCIPPMTFLFIYVCPYFMANLTEFYKAARADYECKLKTVAN